MKELWINSELMDLYPDEPIAVTKQANKLNELKDRQADYSNQFKVPPTGNNLRICGFVDRVSSNSINPYTKLSCRLVDNGTEIVSNGVAIIEEYVGGDINITAYSGIFDFFDTLGEKTLRDLDLSDADHIFNLDNVEAGNTSDKYIYPLIQWGATDSDDDEVDIRYQMPAVYVSWLVDKIFEGTGYNKSGNIFSFPSYENLVVPIVEDSLIDDDAVLLSQSVIAHTLNPISLSGSNGKVPFYYFGSGDAFNSSAGYWNGVRYTAQIKVTVNITFKAYVTIGSGSYDFFITKNYPGGGIGFGGNSPYVISGNGDQHSGSSYHELTLYNYILNPGEFIEPWINTPNGFTIATVQPTGSIFGAPSDYSSFEVEAINTIELGQNLSLQNLVPEILQKDLLKELAYMYGIVFQIDHRTRTVEFRQFKEIAENKYNESSDPNNRYDFVDWSDKLYVSTNPKDPNNPGFKFRFDSYGQNNHARWGQDDDRAEAGSGIIFIDDNTLKKDNDLFSPVFSASIQESNFKGNTGVNIKRFTRVEEEPTEFEKTESAAPRILLVRDYLDNGSPPSSSLTYTDGTDSQVITNAKIAYFVDPLQEYDLGFNFLIQAHYQELISVLTKTKIVNAKFNLSEKDFKNIDFFKPVYIRYFGDYFYINEVKNFLSGRLTSVELVRL